MTVVSAFLVPGSPLPMLRPDNPPWQPLAEGYRAAGASLAASKPDVIAVYSTQWIAVLDELWQTRPHVQGVHVDENWHEYGDLPFDMQIDTALAEACIGATAAFGVRSKGVPYEGFPIDTGSIVANHFMNGPGAPVVICSNNIYHDWETTQKLGATAAAQADALGRRIALVSVGGLSGTLFREDIDIREDRIASAGDDKWNKRMLDALEKAPLADVLKLAPQYAEEARVDMGFKHFAWLLGGLGGEYADARVHAYGPVYGQGAAVVEFSPRNH